jgi:hypothetical protein
MVEKSNPQSSQVSPLEQFSIDEGFIVATLSQF